MGIRDSSKTRVVPVFDHLWKSDSTGSSWLPKLLRLPICGNTLTLPSDCDFTIQGEPWWGNSEKKLDPPVALLSWLIRHPQVLALSKAASDPATPEKRRELLGWSDRRMIEALSLLRHNPQREDWHIFEGQTQPDVFIQTPSILVIVEGKRTERKPTTTTRWMGGRHQMLRHIDCAWEIRGKRQVVGFFIVEGDHNNGEVPLKWCAFAKDTVSPEAIASSLPHRGPVEQGQIAGCFVGVTSWQKTCSTFGIDGTVLPDATDQ